MEVNTNLRNITSTKRMITAFGGLNKTRTIRGAGESSLCELERAYNASSESFPALSVRDKRYVYDIDQSHLAFIPSIEAMYNGGLLFICKRRETEQTEPHGSYCTYNNHVFWTTEDGVTLEENSGDHSFANMGAFIVIMPEGIWFNTVKAKEYIAEEEEEEHTVSLSEVFGKIEVEVEFRSGSENACLAYPCFDDSSPAKDYPTGHTFPEAHGYMLSDGVDDEIITTYTEDNTGINVYRYQKATKKYLLQTEKIIRFEKTGIGIGFNTGDCIEIENLQIINNAQATPKTVYDLDFGNYGVITDRGENFISVRFNEMNSDSYAKYCTKWTHGSTNAPFVALSDFVFRRPVPKMKYITAWNNRIWGCGGDNNNTIYASALGDPRSWVLYDNTAADSYWANVGDGEEWKGAVTYGDHAYFFKENKYWKMYGNRPANFSYTEFESGTIDGKSICTVGNALMFCRRDGVYATNGSAPVKISDKLGDDDFISPAVGFGHDGRYYIETRRENSDAALLYVFDLTRSVWNEETPYPGGIRNICNIPDNVIVLSDGNYSLREKTGVTRIVPDKVPFEVVLAEFTARSFDYKYITALQISGRIETGGMLGVYVMLDGDGRWMNVKNIHARESQNILVPVLMRRSQRAQIKLSGYGSCEIYGVSFTTQGGSERDGKC